MTQNNTFVKSIGYICFLFFTLLPLNSCSNSNNQDHAKTTSIVMVEEVELLKPHVIYILKKPKINYGLSKVAVLLTNTP